MSRKKKDLHKQKPQAKREWSPFVPAAANITLEQVRKWTAHVPGITEEQIQNEFRRLQNELVFLNDTYQVSVSKFKLNLPGWPSEMFHLSIKRRDKGVIRDWRVLQRIKNEILGSESEAVELFPRESRLVDSANQYHMWGTKDPDFQFPFGFKDRLVIGEPGEGSKQRGFDEQ